MTDQAHGQRLTTDGMSDDDRDLYHLAGILDDIEVDAKGMCKWTDVANAQTIMRAALHQYLRAARPVPAPVGLEREEMIALLDKYVDGVRHYLHLQIGKPLSKHLVSAPEIALDNLHREMRAALSSTDGRSSAWPVAWIAFAGNGNIRFWTADPVRAAAEKERGMDLRAFTLAELVALAAKPHIAGRSDKQAWQRLQNEDPPLKWLLECLRQMAKEAVGKEPLIAKAEDHVCSLAADLIESAACPSIPVACADLWQDIATAPKDGTEINGYRPDQGVFTFRWAEVSEFENAVIDCHDDPEFACWWHDRWGWMEGDLTPTHWRPLPDAPCRIPADSAEANNG